MAVGKGNPAFRDPVVPASYSKACRHLFTPWLALAWVPVTEVNLRSQFPEDDADIKKHLLTPVPLSTATGAAARLFQAAAVFKPETFDGVTYPPLVERILWGVRSVVLRCGAFSEFLTLLPVMPKEVEEQVCRYFGLATFVEAVRSRESHWHGVCAVIDDNRL